MDPSNEPDKKADLPQPEEEDIYKEIPIKDFSYVNTSSQLPPKPKNKKGPTIIAICALILILAVGTAVYFVSFHPKAKTPTPKATTSSKTRSQKSKTNQSSALTSTYSSTAFGLNLNYPTGWVVSANGSQFIDITSQAVKLTADTGKQVDGKIVISVLPEGQIPTGFGSQAVAVLNSQIISFNNPSSSQAAQTYISYSQYSSTNIKGGLDAVYVTGNNGYLKDQNMPSSDLATLNPLVVTEFEQCQSASCSSLHSLTISGPWWSTSALSSTVISIIKSFTFT